MVSGKHHYAHNHITSLQPQVYHLDSIRAGHPEDIITSRRTISLVESRKMCKIGVKPDQHQAQCPRILPVDKLLRVAQEHIHVRVNALELTAVLGLAPF